LVGSGAAICDGTKKARAEHARALLEDGGDQSLMSGQVLLSQMDSACPLIDQTFADPLIP
jgi:hypothetical protein